MRATRWIVTLAGVVGGVALIGLLSRPLGEGAAPRAQVPPAAGLPPTAALSAAPAAGSPAVAGGGVAAIAPAAQPAAPVAVAGGGMPAGVNAAALTPEARAEWIRDLDVRAVKERRQAYAQALAQGIEPRGEHDGRAYEWASLRDHRVYVRTTHNANARISTAADRVLEQAPFAPSGDGLVVGLWDAGSILTSHVEFGWRALVRDGAPVHYHSTHAGATLIGQGVDARAMGMAPGALLDSYDWNSDYAEMAARGMATLTVPDAIQISNHSYGYQAGWAGATWYGAWGDREAEGFGMYDSYAALLDQVCQSAPYFLPFKAAGNDRNDVAPGTGVLFTYFDDDGNALTKPYNPATDPPSDNWDRGGYDTIAYDANAKNIMTVGAVNDAVSGGMRSLAAAGISFFSSWGPTDDGRIKPDIVANGLALISAGIATDSSYTTLSGTSMATPNAAGSALLLADAYRRGLAGQVMRASTLKGLILHTADDLGTPGPDYRFGWGLMNTRGAYDLIVAHAAWPSAGRMQEARLASGGATNSVEFLWDGIGPIRVTLCWTDPPGTPRTLLDDRTPTLVHDLNLRVIDPLGQVHLPFVLDVNSPTNAATLGVNRVDNVEQVRIAAPPAPGSYRIEVAAPGALSPTGQAYSLLVSAAAAAPEIVHVPLQNTLDNGLDYTLEAQIRSESDLAPGEPRILWASDVDGVAHSTPMAWVSGELYRATLPAQPFGGTISYYLSATTTNGLTGTHPAGAPAQQHQFTVTEAVGLFVMGNPVKVPGVSPDYGFYLYPSGVTVQASSPALGPETNDTRYLCRGFSGLGDLPPSGTNLAVSFALTRDTLLAWEWSTAYALRQTSSIPGLVGVTSWWGDGTQATTTVAQTSAAVQGTNYAFIGWYLDGLRLPDVTNRAVNPAGGIVMTTPRTVEARYLNRLTDADGDGLLDWWEHFYFGGLQATANIDADGDGFSNLSEWLDGADPTDPGSTPESPAIAHTPLASPQGLPAPWAVSAIITDNDRVASATLQWRRNGGAWQSSGMTVPTNSTRYAAVIPAPAVTGDTIEYRLVARDRAGFQSVNGIYTVPVRYPIAQVNPSNLGTTLLPSGSSQSKLLMVSNAGHTNLFWSLTGLGAGLRDDVEGGTNGWTHGGSNDVWHVSGRRAFSGGQAWYFGNEADGEYPDMASAWLLSPPIYLAEGSEFSYRQWLQTEEVLNPEQAWDGARVEISLDDGRSFSPIDPVGGYPYTMYGHSASAWPMGTPCFAGTGGWERVAFDLSGFASQTVRLRLQFGSDGFIVGEGWYVDDLDVTPYGGGADWLEILTPGGGGEVAPGGFVAAGLQVSTALVAPGDSRSGVVRLQSNDPLQPVRYIPLALHNSTRFISVVPDGAGSVAPSGTVATVLGDTNRFLIQAAPYHHVSQVLTGATPVALPDRLSATNLAWIVGDVPVTNTLAVNFAPNMATNGVPESWLVVNGLTNAAFDVEALEDRDGDGHAAWKEFWAGTDPRVRSSVLALTHLSAVGDYASSPIVVTNALGQPEVIPLGGWIAEGYRLEWPSVTGRYYRVYISTNGIGDEVAGPRIEATPPLNVHTDRTEATSRHFYRIGVDLE